MCLYEEKAKIELDTISNFRNFPSLSLSFSLTSLSLSRQLSNYSLYLFLFVSLSPSLSLSLSALLLFLSFNLSILPFSFLHSLLHFFFLVISFFVHIILSLSPFFLSFFFLTFLLPSVSLTLLFSLSLSFCHSLTPSFLLSRYLHLFVKKNVPTRASFCLFSFFSNTNFTEKTVGFSKIRTRIVGVEGQRADKLTTATAQVIPIFVPFIFSVSPSVFLSHFQLSLYFFLSFFLSLIHSLISSISFIVIVVPFILSLSRGSSSIALSNSQTECKCDQMMK